MYQAKLMKSNQQQPIQTPADEVIVFQRLKRTLQAHRGAETHYIKGETNLLLFSVMKDVRKK